MAFFSKIFKKSISNSRQLRDALFGSLTATRAGVAVNPHRAMQCVPYFASVRSICEAVEQLPFLLYERNSKDPRIKTRAINHKLYDLLHNSPNEYQTSSEFRQEMNINALVKGAAYAYINRTSGGVQEIIPIDPDNIIIESTKFPARLTYKLRNEAGEDKVLAPDQLFRMSGFPGFTLGSSNTKGVYNIKSAIGLSMAAEDFGALTFSNGAVSSGFIKTPNQLSPEAKKNILSSMENMIGGENKAKLGLLDEGMDFDRVSMNPEEMQSIETRKHQRSEIAGAVGVPPHKIGDLDKASFSNIENQSLEFVIYSILPWCNRWEQAVNKYLLTEVERRKYFAQLLVDGLLRGDIDSRSKAYQLFIRNGIMTPNEVRERENLNPALNKYGDEFFYTADLTPSSLLKEKQEK